MTDTPRAEQFIAALLQGLAKPVGGDAEGTVSLAEDEDGEARGDRQAPHVAAELKTGRSCCSAYCCNGTCSPTIC